jgi:hypothetical protein
MDAGQKKKFEDAAAKDKLRYAQAMAAYNTEH